jgi:hypothetical protein
MNTHNLCSRVVDLILAVFIAPIIVTIERAETTSNLDVLPTPNMMRESWHAGRQGMQATHSPSMDTGIACPSAKIAGGCCISPGQITSPVSMLACQATQAISMGGDRPVRRIGYPGTTYRCMHKPAHLRAPVLIGNPRVCQHCIHLRRAPPGTRSSRCVPLAGA